MSIFETFNPIFNRFVLGNISLKQLATGFDWVEGPVWFGDANCLLFSDIPNNRILRWTPNHGITVYREPSNFANGHTRDHSGRLLSCEHGSRRVTRTELDGSITVIADSYEGKRLNSPNDVIVHSDGSIWFSDPHYGIMSNYEGYLAEQELPCHVYQVNPANGEIQAVITDFNCPNGLAFSPDEKRLYVSETGAVHDEEAQRHIRTFNVDAKGHVTGGEILHEVQPGCADGFRLDTDGNIWTSAGDGVHCISAEGELLGKIKVPEVVSNVCFGGRAKHQLYITATTSLYMITLNRQGIQHP